MCLSDVLRNYTYLCLILISKGPLFTKNNTSTSMHAYTLPLLPVVDGVGQIQIQITTLVIPYITHICLIMWIIRCAHFCNRQIHRITIFFTLHFIHLYNWFVKVRPLLSDLKNIVDLTVDMIWINL